MKKPRLFLFNTHRIAEMMKESPEQFESSGYECFSLKYLKLIPGSKAANISRDVDHYVLRFFRAKYGACQIDLAANSGKFADRSQYFIKFDTATPELNQSRRRYAARIMMASVLLAEDDLAFWWNREQKCCEFERASDMCPGEIILGEVLFRQPACFDGEWEASEASRIKLFDITELSRFCVSPYENRYFGYIPLNRAINALGFRAVWTGKAPDRLSVPKMAEVYADYYLAAAKNCQKNLVGYGDEFDETKRNLDYIVSVAPNTIMAFLNSPKSVRHSSLIEREIHSDTGKSMYFNALTNNYWIE